MLISLPIPDHLAWEIPKESLFAGITRDGKTIVHWSQKEKYYIPLPPGSYTFLFLSGSASEEDAKGVVEIDENCSESDWYKYKSYSHEGDWPLSLAVNSLNSALVAAGCDSKKNYAIIKKEK